MQQHYKHFPRITVDPEQMAGVPRIRGLRIPVAAVVAMVADGIEPKRRSSATTHSPE